MKCEDLEVLGGLKIDLRSASHAQWCFWLDVVSSLHSLSNGLGVCFLESNGSIEILKVERRSSK